MPERTRRRRWSRWLVALAAIVVLAAAGLYWSRQEAAPRVVYDTETLDRGPIVRTVSATGPVRALVTVDVSSQLSGQISDVAVDYNDRVAKGDLLAVIDPQTFRTQVASAEADLAVARSNYKVQQANVAKARALLEQAKTTYARQQTLAARGNVSQSVLDQAKTDLGVAEAEINVARAQLDQAASTIKQREAALEQARINLARTEIRSPIDGVIIERAVDPGQTVAASLQAPTLFRIAQDLSHIQIEAAVDEADIGGISAGNPVTFTVDAYSGVTFDGVVEQVRLAATELQNVVTYTVVIRADNQEQRLLPGMTTTVTIVTGRRDDVLRAPNAALRFRPPQQSGAAPPGDDGSGAATLWVVGEGGGLAARHVRLGLADNFHTEIAGGDLSAGDAVVVRAQSESRR
jgi:HlyD family secretion protein